MRTALALIVLAALAFPAPARADDPFALFRIPAHRARSANASGSVFGYQDTYGEPAFGYRAHSVSGDANVGFDQLWDSDALRCFTTARVAGSSSTSHRDEHDMGATITDVTDARESREVWALGGGVRAYPWARPVGLDVRVDVTGDYAQGRSQDDRTTIYLGYPWQRVDVHDLRTTHLYRTAVRALAAVGYGRVRDASVVFDVHVLEDRLREGGALARPLSAAARERLAALLFVAPDLTAAHERPDRFVWREVERILRDDGALSERGLDPYSVMRGREPVFGRVARNAGWFVGPVVRANSSHLVQRSAEDYSDVASQADTVYFQSDSHDRHRDVADADDFQLGGTVEYHRPIGWAWQVDATSMVTAATRTGERGLQSYSSVVAQWLIADRWSATGNLSHQRYYFSPRDWDGVMAVDQWSVDYGLSLGYFLEDHLQLSASVSESQGRNLVDYYFPSPSEDRAYRRHGTFRLGVSYRFLGRLEAPGLIEPALPVR